MAAATNPKMRTARLDPVRRRDHDLNDFSAHAPALFLYQPHLDSLTRQSIRQKDDPPIWQPPNRISPVGQGRQSNLVCACVFLAADHYPLTIVNDLLFQELVHQSQQHVKILHVYFTHVGNPVSFILQLAVAICNAEIVG